MSQRIKKGDEIEVVRYGPVKPGEVSVVGSRGIVTETPQVTGLFARVTLSEEDTQRLYPEYDADDVENDRSFGWLFFEDEIRLIQ
jgi:hypothetical protein